MCGIIGFTGNGKAAPILLRGLQRLEYRGYQSAGVATISDGKLWVKKDVEGPNEVEEKHRISELPGMAGIGHTRWATTGEVSQINAHPHLDCTHKIAVVHNGIIENYEGLRRRLSSKHKFVSQTDTEVIPHLIEEYMGSGLPLEKALYLAAKELDGAYALLAISSKEPGKIVATCKNEPLLLGLDTNGNFIASDLLAFLEKTNRVIHIEDGEVAVVTEAKVTLYDGEAREIEKEPQKVDLKYEEATRQGHDFFMLKEIMEQPLAIRKALIQDKNLVTEMAQGIKEAEHVVLTASGSSRYSALLGRYLFSRFDWRLGEVIMGSESQYYLSDSADKKTLVIAVSQSGETADVLDGVRAAKGRGATVFSIINRPASMLERLSHRVIYLNCGPEIGVAATKSFISQLVIFYLLSFAMAGRLEELLEKIKAIPPLVEEEFQRNGKGLVEIAQGLSKERDCYLIGRGGNLHIASEGALKLKEIAYIHAEGMPAGELKHGTLALIEKGTPVVAICPRDHTFYDMLSNAEEAKAWGAFIIGVSSQREKVFDQWIEIPEVEESLYPLITVVPLQLLAYHTAIAKGLNPDKPRNLAKSVTVK